MNQGKIKKIIGSVCKYLTLAIVGFLVFCLFMSIKNEVGFLGALIIITAGILVIFIMWAAVNWGDL